MGFVLSGADLGIDAQPQATTSIAGNQRINGSTDQRISELGCLCFGGFCFGVCLYVLLLLGRCR